MIQVLNELMLVIKVCFCNNILNSMCKSNKLCRVKLYKGVIIVKSEFRSTVFFLLSRKFVDAHDCGVKRIKMVVL